MDTSRADLFLLEAWVSENPGSRLFLELARAYREQGRREEAVRVLERGLVLRPEEVAARRLLARVLLESGDQEGALDQLRAAAAELARHAGVFDDLAAALEQQGLGEQAGTARELGRSLATWTGPAGSKPASPPRPAAEPLSRTSPPAAVRPEAPVRPAQDLVLSRLQALRRAALARAGS